MSEPKPYIDDLNLPAFSFDGLPPAGSRLAALRRKPAESPLQRMQRLEREQRAVESQRLRMAERPGVQEIEAPPEVPAPVQRPSGPPSWAKVDEPPPSRRAARVQDAAPETPSWSAPSASPAAFSPSAPAPYPGDEPFAPAGIQRRDTLSTEGAGTALEAFGRGAERTAGEAVGGTVGLWAGAKGGAALGTAVGAMFGGVGAPVGAAAGSLIGGLLGMFGGGWLGKQSQKAVMGEEAWNRAEEQYQRDMAAHPLATLGGSLAPHLATLAVSPGGALKLGAKGAKAADAARAGSVAWLQAGRAGKVSAEAMQLANEVKTTGEAVTASKRWIRMTRAAVEAANKTGAAKTKAGARVVESLSGRILAYNTALEKEAAALAAARKAGVPVIGRVGQARVAKAALASKLAHMGRAATDYGEDGEYNAYAPEVYATTGDRLLSDAEVAWAAAQKGEKGFINQLATERVADPDRLIGSIPFLGSWHNAAKQRDLEARRKRLADPVAAYGVAYHDNPQYLRDRERVIADENARRIDAAREQTVRGIAGQIIGDMPAFMVEIANTPELGNLGAARGALARVGGGMLQAAIQSNFQPGAVAANYERNRGNEWTITEDEWGALNLAVQRAGNGTVKAMWKGWAQNAVEYVSEVLGEYMQGVVAAGGRRMMKAKSAMPKKLGQFFAEVFGDTPAIGRVRGTLRAGAVQPFFESLEERAGDFLKAALFADDREEGEGYWQHLFSALNPGWQQWLAEQLAFLPLGGVQIAGAWKERRRLEREDRGGPGDTAAPGVTPAATGAPSAPAAAPDAAAGDGGTEIPDETLVALKGRLADFLRQSGAPEETASAVAAAESAADIHAAMNEMVCNAAMQALRPRLTDEQWGGLQAYRDPRQRLAQAARFVGRYSELDNALLAASAALENEDAPEDLLRRTTDLLVSLRPEWRETAQAAATPREALMEVAAQANAELASGTLDPADPRWKDVTARDLAARLQGARGAAEDARIADLAVDALVEALPEADRAAYDALATPEDRAQWLDMRLRDPAAALNADLAVGRHIARDGIDAPEAMLAATLGRLKDRFAGAWALSGGDSAEGSPKARLASLVAEIDKDEANRRFLDAFAADNGATDSHDADYAEMPTAVEAAMRPVGMGGLSDEDALAPEEEAPAAAPEAPAPQSVQQDPAVVAENATTTPAPEAPEVPESPETPAAPAPAEPPAPAPAPEAPAPEAQPAPAAPPAPWEPAGTTAEQRANTTRIRAKWLHDGDTLYLADGSRATVSKPGGEFGPAILRSDRHGTVELDENRILSILSAFRGGREVTDDIHTTSVGTDLHTVRERQEMADRIAKRLPGIGVMVYSEENSAAIDRILAESYKGDAEGRRKLENSFKEFQKSGKAFFDPTSKTIFIGPGADFSSVPHEVFHGILHWSETHARGLHQQLVQMLENPPAAALAWAQEHYAGKPRAILLEEACAELWGRRIAEAVSAEQRRENDRLVDNLARDGLTWWGRVCELCTRILQRFVAHVPEENRGRAPGGARIDLDSLGALARTSPQEAARTLYDAIFSGTGIDWQGTEWTQPGPTSAEKGPSSAGEGTKPAAPPSAPSAGLSSGSSQGNLFPSSAPAPSPSPSAPIAEPSFHAVRIAGNVARIPDSPMGWLDPAIHAGTVRQEASRRNLKGATPATPLAKVRQLLQAQDKRRENGQALLERTRNRSFNDPLLEHLFGGGRKIRVPSSIAFERARNKVPGAPKIGGEWDGFERALFPGLGDKLVPVISGWDHIDSIAQEARHVLQGGGDWTADSDADYTMDDFWQDLARACKNEAEYKEHAKQEDLEARQYERFEKDALSARPGTTPVPVETLEGGDKLNVNGVELKVENVLPDGTVTLSDGNRYGEQVVQDGQTLHAEVVSTRAENEAAEKAGLPDRAALAAMSKPQLAEQMRREGLSAPDARSLAMAKKPDLVSRILAARRRNGIAQPEEAAGEDDVPFQRGSLYTGSAADWSTATIPELRRELVRRGLSPSGSAAALRRRLEEADRDRDAIRWQTGEPAAPFRLEQQTPGQIAAEAAAAKRLQKQQEAERAREAAREAKAEAGRRQQFDDLHQGLLDIGLPGETGSLFAPRQRTGGGTGTLFQRGGQAAPARDWSRATIPEMRRELAARGLPATGDATRLRLRLAGADRRRTLDTGNDPDNGIRFQADRTLERRKDLVAMHNVSPKGLAGMDNLGGLAVPSFAITKDTIGFDKFGSISLLVRPATIDPKKTDSRAKLFSNDAWTPAFPATRRHADEKKMEKLDERFYRLFKNPANAGWEKVADGWSAIFDEDNLDDALTNHDGDAVAALRDNRAVMVAYLLETGKAPAVPTKAVLPEWRGLDASAIPTIAEALGDKLRRGPDGMSISDADELLQDESFQRKLAEILDATPQVRELIDHNPNMSYVRQVERGRAVTKRYWDIQQLSEAVSGQMDGRGAPQAADRVAALAAVKEAIAKDPAAYDEWLRALTDGLADGRQWVRNKRDPFNRAGYHRSFKELHDPLTLANAVKAMLAQPDQGGSGFFAGNPFGTAARQYRSLDGVIADEDRLKSLSKEELDAVKAELSDRFLEIADEYGRTQAHKDSNPFIQMDRNKDMLLDSYAETRGSKARLLKALNAYGYKADGDFVDRFLAVMEDMSRMPVDYFEAKAYRAVGFDEVVAAIVPDDAPAGTRDILRRRGIQSVFYKAGDAADRLAKLNEAADSARIKFQFGGERGAARLGLGTADEARRMEASGADRTAIWRKTGWWKGRDGKWRVEIPDITLPWKDLPSRAAELDRAKTLMDALKRNNARNLAALEYRAPEDYRAVSNLILKANELREEEQAGKYSLRDFCKGTGLETAYPELMDIPVRFILPAPGNILAKEGSRAAFDGKAVYVSRNLDADGIRSTIAHEIQHAIQGREDLARGASPEYWQEQIDGGYDSRMPGVKAEEARLLAQYEAGRAANPELYADMEELWRAIPTVPRGKVDFDTLEQLEEDPPEWKRYDERRNALEKKHGEAIWDWFRLRRILDNMSRAQRDDAYGLYRRTAGEVEARNVQERLSMTPEERAATPPWETEDVDAGSQIVHFQQGSRDWSTATIPELRRELVRRGLSPSGSAATLRRRLEEATQPTPESREPQVSYTAPGAATRKRFAENSETAAWRIEAEPSAVAEMPAKVLPEVEPVCEGTDNGPVRQAIKRLFLRWESEAKKAARDNGENENEAGIENEHTGEKVLFNRNDVGKMMMQSGVDMRRFAPHMRGLFESAFLAWSEPPMSMQGHADRDDVTEYRQYVAKFDGFTDEKNGITGPSFVRFTVRVLQSGRHGVHAATVTDIEVLKNKDATTLLPAKKLGGHGRTFMDHKLSLFFSTVKPETLPKSSLRFQRGSLYTGSAADYANRRPDGSIENGPSLHHIGSGEGSQVYGWGLYASDRRGVAQSYAKNDAKFKSYPRVFVDGEEVASNPYSVEISMRDEIYEALRGEDFDKAKGEARLDRIIEQEEGLLRDPWFGQGTYAAERRKRVQNLREALNLMRSGRVQIQKNQASPYLYEQTFFTNRATPEETERHLLKWYEPVVAEQAEWIVDELAREFGTETAPSGTITSRDYPIRYADGEKATRFWMGKTGEGLYRELAHTLGSPRAASEFLARADIDGVKYPVNSYGGKSIKDGDTAGWNYVSFRDDNIRVDHKWRDGEQLFQKGADPQMRMFNTWDNAHVELQARKKGHEWHVVAQDGTDLGRYATQQSAEFALALERSMLEAAGDSLSKLKKAKIADIAEARRKLVDLIRKADSTKEERADAIAALGRALGLHPDLAAKEWKVAESILRTHDPESTETAVEHALRIVNTVLARASIKLHGRDMLRLVREKAAGRKGGGIRKNVLLPVQKAFALIREEMTADEKARCLEEMDRAIEKEDAELNSGEGRELTPAELEARRSALDDKKVERELFAVFGGLATLHGGQNRARLAIDARAWADASARLAVLAEKGVQELKEKRIARATQAKELRDRMIHDLTGGRGIPDSEQERQDAKNARGWRERARELVRGLVSYSMGGGEEWGEMLTRDKSVAFGQSTASRLLHDGLAAGYKAKLDADKADRAEALRILSSHFKIDPETDLRNTMDLSEKCSALFTDEAVDDQGNHEITVRSVHVKGSGRKKETTVSVGGPCTLKLGELMHFYLIGLQAEEAAGQAYTDTPKRTKGADCSLMDALVRHGFAAETMMEIRAALQKRGLDTLALQISADMEKKGDALDDLMVKEYNSQLKRVHPYAPLRRLHWGLTEQGDAGGGGVGSFMSMARSFLKERVANLRDFQTVNLIESWQSHNQQVNHIIHLHDWISTVGRVMRHADMQTALDFVLGNTTRESINAWLDIQARGGSMVIRDDGIPGALARNFAVAVTTNPRVTLKQLTSAPMGLGMLPEGASTWDWFKDMARIAFPCKERRDFLAFLDGNSPEWRERGENASDTLQLLNRHKARGTKLGMGYELVRLRIQRWLGKMTRWGDRTGALMGCYGVFRAWERKFLAEGMAPAAAKIAALERFDHSVNAGQQSVQQEYMSRVQTMGGLYKYMSMFHTAQIAMTRNIYTHAKAWLEHRGSRREHERAIAGVVVSAWTFRLMGMGMMLPLWQIILGILQGDPDKLKTGATKTIQEGLLSIAEAPCSGVLPMFPLGDAIVGTAEGFIKGDTWGRTGNVDVIPQLSVIASIPRIYSDFTRKADNRDWMAVARHASDFIGQTTGIPVTPAIDAISGTADAWTAPDLTPEQRVARQLTFSRSAIGAPKRKPPAP